MDMTSPQTFRKEIVAYLLLSTLSGALAGFAASLFRPDMVEVASQTVPRTATGTEPLVTPTTTFSLVPVERRPAAALVPPAFLSRGTSALATIYRKPKPAVAPEDRLLGPDRLLGEAVVLTSDGWFVTSAGILAGLHPTDIVLWHDGLAYPVIQGIADSLNGTVFLKTGATGLTSSAFAHVSELPLGAGIWLEARPGELAPSVVLNLAFRALPNDALSSEVAARRILLSGQSQDGDRGGAAWDPNGSLLGLIESEAGEGVRIIPASGIAASFSSLLTNGGIQHALLGVRAIDLSSIRMDGVRGTLPARGAWIHDDKKSGKPGIARDSPAAKAALRAGDVILRVERDILDGTADLGEVLADYRPGATVTLRVLRDGSDQDVQVTLGSLSTGEPIK